MFLADDQRSTIVEGDRLHAIGLPKDQLFGNGGDGRFDPGWSQPGRVQRGIGQDKQRIISDKGPRRSCRRRVEAEQLLPADAQPCPGVAGNRGIDARCAGYADRVQRIVEAVHSERIDTRNEELVADRVGSVVGVVVLVRGVEQGPVLGACRDGVEEKEEDVEFPHRRCA